MEIDIPTCEKAMGFIYVKGVPVTPLLLVTPKESVKTGDDIIKSHNNLSYFYCKYNSAIGD